MTDAEEPAVAEMTDEAVPDQPEETEQPQEEPAADVGTSGTPGGQHMVEAGDNLWTISQDFYDTGKLWPNIYRVNLDHVPNPDYLSIGIDIQVPSLQGKPDQLTRQDSEGIAKGFLEAYLFYRDTDRRKALSYLWVVKKWNMDDVIAEYQTRIDAGDLDAVEAIEGVPRFR